MCYPFCVREQTSTALKCQGLLLGTERPHLQRRQTPNAHPGILAPYPPPSPCRGLHLRGEYCPLQSMITWVETACLNKWPVPAPGNPVELSKVLTLILVWGLLVQGDYSEFRLYGCVL